MIAAADKRAGRPAPQAAADRIRAQQDQLLRLAYRERTVKSAEYPRDLLRETGGASAARPSEPSVQRRLAHDRARAKEPLLLSSLF